MNNIHPAQLWIGSQQALEAEVISFYKKFYVPMAVAQHVRPAYQLQ